jgi:hypothetical protein
MQDRKRSELEKAVKRPPPLPECPGEYSLSVYARVNAVKNINSKDKMVMRTLKMGPKMTRAIPEQLKMSDAGRP